MALSGEEVRRRLREFAAQGGGYVVRGIIVVAAILVAGVISVAAGIPPKEPPNGLPDTALGSEILFYIERAAALLGAVLLIGWRTVEGHFPRMFGPVEYEAADQTATVTQNHEERLQLLEALAGLGPPPDNRDGS